jgi:cytochrome c553
VHKAALYWLLGCCCLLGCAMTGTTFADMHAPDWAFFFPDRNPPREAPRDAKYALPGSSKTYTQAQIDDHKNIPDWFPESHPPAPRAVISGGQSPMAWACGECHLISGMGHPEASSLAGLPLPYLERQFAEFLSGARANRIMVAGKPQFNPVQGMILIANSWPQADAEAAMQYFASLKPQAWVTVVETRRVPRSYINAGYMRVQTPDGGTEPLGQRIVELPKDRERALLRDPNSGTIAYVPIGAIARGEGLVQRGATACTTCHGKNLTGLEATPSIAGRSPLYIVRQLFFFKEGSRNGSMSSTMKAQVETLSNEDFIDIGAYLASLPPS